MINLPRHAIVRAKGRYDIKLTDEDCDNIVDKIFRNEYHHLLTIDNELVHLVIMYAGKWLLTLYNKCNYRLVTFYPPMNIDRYDNHDFLYKDGDIIHINELIDRIHFQLFGTYN